MFVIDVLPLVAAAPPGALSYRSAKKFPVGSVVEVVLRRKKVPAVVLAATPLLEAKAALKLATFALSGGITGPLGRLPVPLMEAVTHTALFHAASPGAVLASLVPRDAIASLPEVKAPHGTGFTLLPLELPLPERATRYRESVREAASSKQATLLAVSTIAEAEYWKQELAAFAPLVLTGAATGRAREVLFKKVEESRSLVIATPAFSFVPMEHLGHIIVERAGAGGFRLPRRPYVDVRIALMEYARARRLPFMLGDFPLPLEYRSDIRSLGYQGEPVRVIDSRGVPDAQGEKQTWSALSAGIVAAIKETAGAGGRIAVLAVRKGYAPVVVCRHCGDALRDEREKAYAFTQEGGTRLFRTSDGKSELGTDITCPRCGSWDLMPLGVGVERVLEELQEAFPDTAIIEFDSDKARTVSGARKMLAPLASPGTIVVGTEAMVPWLFAASPSPIELAAVASADTLLALPFWRARERFVRLGYLLAALATKVAIATRMPDDAAVALLSDPGSTAFFEEEASLRRALSYPPFGTLILLEWRGTPLALDKLDALVRGALGDVRARKVPDSLVHGAVYRRALVLTLPHDAWPDEALSGKLRGLPPSVRIVIDPESFW